MTDRVESSAGEWTPMRAAVDAERFDRGRIGPYAIGNISRATDFGEVSMALHDALDRVVEIEVFTAASGVEGRLMPDLALAASIEHPNVARIIGAGVEGNVPYVVRPLVLGRTLAQLSAHGPPSIELSACVMFAVAEGLDALARHGPELGACSIGGFDARDVLLAFEGDVLILGSGCKSVRAPGQDAAARDLESAILLAKKLGLEDEVREPVEGFFALAKKLRYGHRDALGTRRARIGGALRERFDATLQEERSFFGLAPIQ